MKVKRKKLILLLHGWNATGKSWFFPHLTKTLTPFGEVHCPSLPNPNVPKLTEWKQSIKSIVRDRTVDLVVGHSLGGVVIMSMLTAGEIKVKNLVTVGTSPGWKDLEHLNNFITPPISFGKVKKSVKKFIAVQSLDDGACAFEYAMVMVKQAGATGVFYAKKGHFVIKKLPNEVLTLIKDILQKK